MVHVDHSRHPVYLSGRSTRGVSLTIANNCSLSKGNETGRRPYASHDTQQLKATAIFFFSFLFYPPCTLRLARATFIGLVPLILKKPTPGPCLVHSRVYVHTTYLGRATSFCFLQYDTRFDRFTENLRLLQQQNATSHLCVYVAVI